MSDTWWQVARRIVHRSKRHGLSDRCVHRRNRGQNRPLQRPQGTTVDAQNAGRGKAHYLSGNDAKKIKHFVTRAHLKREKFQKIKDSTKEHTHL